MKNKAAVIKRLICNVTLDYYYHEPSLARHRLWGLQYQNLESIRLRLILVGSVEIRLNLVLCFLLLCIFPSIFQTKSDTQRHIIHIHSRTHTHEQIAGHLQCTCPSVLHVFELWGKTGAPGRKPTSAAQSEHANTTQKKASFLQLFRFICVVMMVNLRENSFAKGKYKLFTNSRRMKWQKNHLIYTNV